MMSSSPPTTAAQAAIPSSPTNEEGEDFPTVHFDVVKKHHKMTWLKQKRVLVITTTDVKNCKPPSTAGVAPVPTKSHRIEDLEIIACKSKTSMMLRFKNDHDYFYSSPRTMDILWELRRRLVALRAAQRLSESGSGAQRSTLMKLFASGTLSLPQFNEQDEVEEKKLDLIRCLRAGGMDDADHIGKLVNEILTTSEEDLDLFAVRERIEVIKNNYIDQVVTGNTSLGSRMSASWSNRPLPDFDDPSDAERCVEETLQTLVIVPAYQSLWANLHLQSDIIGQESHFLSQCALLSTQPLDFFGVPQELTDIKYDLVLQQLEKVSSVKTPSDMLDNIMGVAKSILLTVRATRRVFSGELPEVRSRSDTLAADDVLPLYIYILVHSQVKELVFVREWISRLGDPNECTERSYFFTMFSSAVEFISTCAVNSDSPSDYGEASPHSRAQSYGPVHSPFSEASFCSPQSVPTLSKTVTEGTGLEDTDGRVGAGVCIEGPSTVPAMDPLSPVAKEIDMDKI